MDHSGKNQESASLSLEDLFSSFVNPPAEYSPVPIWWWSGDRLERPRLRWQMEQLIAGGSYNAIILNLAPTGPLYGSDPDQPFFLSESWWDIFLSVCQDAQELGMRLWFYDQIGFSGANLQGWIVREQPEFAGQSLESLTSTGEGLLELTCPSEGIPLAAAYTLLDDQDNPVGEPQLIPLTGRGVSVNLPERKRLRLMYAIWRGFDYYNPAACARLFEIVHGEFARRAGSYLGTVIVGSFQDELPSLPTWGSDFGRAFEQQYGYDLLDRLAYLWEGESEIAHQVRVDYHQLRAGLAEAAFFRPLFDWHEQHGLICGFDQQGPARSGHPIASVKLYANYLQTHRWFQAPGSDHHGNAKIHSSLAHLYQRRRVWIEAFHSSGWGGTLEETFDWLLPWLGAGATLYDPHAVYYSTRGGWWEWAPPSTCWRQPYWRHYPLFSKAVSRLCSLLSQGTHVCDIAILYPTTTVQAGLTVEASLPAAQAAHEAYQALVGDMMFLNHKPGVLDQDRRDYDILDDASLQDARIRDGKIAIQEEEYSTLILPACTVLQSATVEQLIHFVNCGGRLIAVGELPRLVVGKAEALLADFLKLFTEGKALRIERPEDLPAICTDLPRRVDAPVPVLHRRLGKQEILFVPGAYPHATDTAGLPNFSWLKPSYRFDPQRYQRKLTLRVQGFAGRPEGWNLFTGERYPLPVRSVNSWQEVQVSLEDNPAALIVWSTEGKVLDEPRRRQEKRRIELPSIWACTLEPTLDNRFGDFDKPNYPGAPPIQTWKFAHRIQNLDEDGLRDRWFDPAQSHPFSGVSDATFGQYGWYTGALPVSELPAPLASPTEAIDFNLAGWFPAVYSLQRGIRKDPLHERNLGPKAHVPEEFLHFGVVKKGAGVQFRTSFWVEHPGQIYLAVGAAAAKFIWLNGKLLESGNSPGYLWMEPVALSPGRNLLEFRLLPERDQELRAYWALVNQPRDFQRPERMIAPDEPKKDSQLQFAMDFELPFKPAQFTIQVSSNAPTRLLLNGSEVGRQGGFEPYESLARVQPYSITNARQGRNTLVVEVQDTGGAHGGEPAAVLVDGLAQDGSGATYTLISDPHWQVRRDGGPLQRVNLYRPQLLDPAWSHLWRRPHPLPGATWIEETPFHTAVLPIVPDATVRHIRVEWFKWILPPGATRLHLPLAGRARLWVDGVELELANGMAMAPASEPLPRLAVLRVEPEPGRTGGAVFTGPVTYEVSDGYIRLGEWEAQGLGAYSGGVRYRARFVWTGEPGSQVILDLGKVRGTAEVWINGKHAGARIWSPYRFELSDVIQAGQNDLEVLVLNTLAPYLDAVSPTHYIHPGQKVSGLLGPVQLYEFTEIGE